MEEFRIRLFPQKICAEISSPWFKKLGLKNERSKFSRNKLHYLIFVSLEFHPSFLLMENFLVNIIFPRNKAA